MALVWLLFWLDSWLIDQHTTQDLELYFVLIDIASIKTVIEIAVTQLQLAGKPVGKFRGRRVANYQCEVTLVGVFQLSLRTKDVARDNFPYLHRRIWAHSVVARRLFSQLNGASCV